MWQIIINNYRPISALPVISKVFETVIFDQLTEYFTIINFFSSQQYGFRKNVSTELAALELIAKLLAQLHDFKIPIIIKLLYGIVQSIRQFNS